MKNCYQILILTLTLLGLHIFLPKAAKLFAPLKTISVPRLDLAEMPQNESILFFETNDEITELKARTLCSVESAARYNPEINVYLLLTTKSRLDASTVPAFVGDLPNVKLRKLHITEIVHGTQAEKLWKSGHIAASHFYNSHCSEMLRFVLAYKKGGIYFDQDVISIGPVPTGESDRNFVMSSGNGKFIATAAFKIEMGHELINQTLKRLAKRFDGHYWNTGTLILTDAAASMCKHKGIPIEKGEDKFVHWQCAGFNIKRGFPIPAWEYKLYYDPDKNEEVENLIKDGFMFHYFNKMRTGTNVQRSQGDIIMAQAQPLYIQMKKHCPLTEEHMLRHLVGETY